MSNHCTNTPPKRSRLATLFVATAMFFVIGISAPSANAAKIVASLSVSSFRDAQGLANELNMQLPAFLSPEGVRGMLRLNQGVIETEPVGIFVVGGQGVPQRQKTIIAVPVGKGDAPLHHFLRFGGKPVAGKGDTALWAGIPVRRTNRYLIFGGTLDTIDNLSDKNILALHRVRTTILRAQGDIDELRKSSPQLMLWLKAIEGAARLKGNADLLGAQLITTPIREKVDFADMKLDRLRNDYQLSASVTGFERWKPASFPKPRFPGTVIARIDVVYGDEKLATWPTDLLARFANALSLDRKLSADDRERWEPFLSSVLQLALVGDAVTVAVNEVDGKLVAFLVQQHRKPVDAKAAVTKIVKHAESITRGSDDHRVLADITYKTKTDQEVTRLHVLRQGQEPIAYVDVTQHNRSTIMTIAQDPTRHLEPLLPLRTSGRLSSGVVAEIDLPRALTGLHSLRGGPLENASKAEVAKLAGKLRGKRIAFDARFSSSKLVMKAKFPVTFLKLVDELNKLSRPDL